MKIKPNASNSFVHNSSLQTRKTSIVSSTLNHPADSGKTPKEVRKFGSLYKSINEAGSPQNAYRDLSGGPSLR
jgi:hypothetical protein